MQIMLHSFTMKDSNSDLSLTATPSPSDIAENFWVTPQLVYEIFQLMLSSMLVIKPLCLPEALISPAFKPGFQDLHQQQTKDLGINI